MTDVVRGPAEKALVQTSRDLVDWTTQPDMEYTGGSEGQGEIVGNATFRLAWGEIVRAGQTESEQVSEPTGLDGLFVRVLKQQIGGGGSVTYGDDTFDPVWYGKMLAPDAGTTGANGITNYTASGIAALFNERTCWMGRALSKTSPLTAVIAFDLAPFNRWPSGDRSASTVTVGGVAIYIHDATKTDTGNKWTARQIIDNLMACNFRVESPPMTVDGSGQTGPTWAISDPQGCLTWEPELFDAKGKTIAAVLNALAGKKRGLTWWITVSGSTLTVNVASGLASAITVGTVTVPANPNIWDQLDGADPFIHPFTIRRVSDEVADEIVIRGTPRLIGVTLAIYGSGSPFVANSAAQLEKGWTDSAETACNSFLDTFNAPARSSAYDQAWRRFSLRAEAWNGNQYAAGGMPYGFAPVSDSSYGVNGLDGVLTSGLGGGGRPGNWYRAYLNLPCAPGFSALNVGPRQRAVIFAEDYQSGTWYEHTADWEITVEESPPAVVIDDHASGALVRSILRAGRKILVTVALRDFFPFQVMWRRDPATWPSIIPRIKTINVPDLTQEYLLNGMTYGAPEAGGSLVALSGQLTIKDNLLQLRTLLAQARAFYEQPYDLVTFTDRGVWDTDPDYRPGTLLGNVGDGVGTRVIEALVTRRTWKLEYASGDDGVQVPYWSTTFETDAIYPDLEAVL